MLNLEKFQTYPVIIVPAYQRADSLHRLLMSLNNAAYPTKEIQLIISTDGGASEDVIDVAETFHFSHGNKHVIKREENLGLRKHIIWCGDQTETYDSVIVLEDDLYVDRYYYHYAVNALKFYENDERVSGISLYAKRVNMAARLGFEPMNNGYSAYFMQTPSSWGQAWTKKQWADFKEWYRTADLDTVTNNPRLPAVLKRWPDTSWLKYFAVYMIEKDNYFIYPYLSYTTNCADAGGVHMPEGTQMYQVPLGAYNRPPDKFSFCKPDESAVLYDSFMEPAAEEIYQRFDLSPNDLEIDLHGIKSLSLLEKKKYVLTSKKCHDPIEVFRLGFKPIEKIILDPEASYEPSSGYSDYIFLAESDNIESEKRPFYHQMNYYSYYQTENRYFYRRYILHLIQKLMNKVWKL